MVDTLSKVRLLDICDFISGNAHEQHISELGEFTVINSKFISTEGRVAKSATKNFCPANKDDITLVMSDLPNGRALGKCFLVPEDKKYAVNQRVCILRSKGYDPKYLFYILNRNPYFLSFNDGVSQTHLLNSVFEKCFISITKDIKEQKAIAKALSDIDELIDLTEILIAKKENVFAGALQSEFSDITGAEFSELSSLCDIKKGTAVAYDKEFQVGSCGFINGGIAFSGSTSLSNDDGDTVVVSEGGNSCGFVNYFFEPFWCGGHAYRLKGFKGSQKYLYYALKKSEPEIMNLRVGSGLPNIQKKNLSEFKILIHLDENKQKLIVDFLDSLTEEIRILRLERFKYECIKQAMAHDLLTGKVRLV